LHLKCKAKSLTSAMSSPDIHSQHGQFIHNLTSWLCICNGAGESRKAWRAVEFNETNKQ